MNHFTSVALGRLKLPSREQFHLSSLLPTPSITLLYPLSQKFVPNEFYGLLITVSDVFGAKFFEIFSVFWVETHFFFQRELRSKNGHILSLSRGGGRWGT